MCSREKMGESDHHSDCSRVVDYSTTTPTTNLSNIIMDCRRLQQHLREVTIEYKGKEANRVVDYLAKCALEFGIGM